MSDATQPRFELTGRPFRYHGDPDGQKQGVLGSGELQLPQIRPMIVNFWSDITNLATNRHVGGYSREVGQR
jgi:hypothetical protein